jgi:hypothetical protein
MTSVSKLFALSFVAVVGCSSENLCDDPSQYDVGPGYPVVYSITGYEAVEGCWYRASVTWNWQPDDTVLPATILTRYPDASRELVGTIVWTDDSQSAVMAYEFVLNWSAYRGGVDDPVEPAQQLLADRMTTDTEDGVVAATGVEALTSGAWRGPRMATECEPLALPPVPMPTPEYAKHFPDYTCVDEFGP